LLKARKLMTCGRHEEKGERFKEKREIAESLWLIDYRKNKRIKEKGKETDRS
jgi:hypothetical protein